MLVDDHELVRLGVLSLIASQTAGRAPLAMLEAGTLGEALALYAQHQDSLELVLLDLHLPDAHGLSGLREFLARFPAAPIAVLSADGDPALKRQALQAGARAYLTKSGQMTDVLAYLHAQGLLGARPHEDPSADDPADPVPSDGIDGTARVVQTRDGERLALTQRQGEILDHMLIGLSNREIAQRMHLAEGTIKNNVSTLLLMFGVPSRAQLISRLR